jgi:prolyl 4-hydroxylase
VISVVINVAQDEDATDDWPMELITHTGKAVNVTLRPGDWLLYESHSIIHGRPFPLKGNYYANLFLHLEPKGHSQTHHNHSTTSTPGTTAQEQYKSALQQQSGGHETLHESGLYELFDGLPDYILEDSDEMYEYIEQHYVVHGATSGDTTVHTLAANGRLHELIEFISDNQKHIINSKDHNGWTVRYKFR